MKKQAVLAFALTIVASFYISDILTENAEANLRQAQASDVVVSELSD